jgi:DnaK suppressor protein
MSGFAARCEACGMNTTSDDELRARRVSLQARGDELRDRVRRVRMDLRRESNPLPADLDDAAIVVENDEILEAVEKAALSELERIKLALARLEAGTYLMCEACGRQIGAERLRVVPYATHCRDCGKDG